jgi:hypothetical protein
MMKVTGKLVPVEGALEKKLFSNGVQNPSCKKISSIGLISWYLYMLLKFRSEYIGFCVRIQEKLKKMKRKNMYAILETFEPFKMTARDHSHAGKEARHHSPSPLMLSRSAYVNVYWSSSVHPKLPQKSSNSGNALKVPYFFQLRLCLFRRELILLNLLLRFVR